MMVITDLDDASGKRKVPNVQARSALLTGALLVGMCLGVIVSEKLYLIAQEADMPEGAVAAVRSRKLEVSGGSTPAVRRSTGKPRNELEEILQRVAPQGEVMIAISNYDLVEDRELLMWLEVGGTAEPLLCFMRHQAKTLDCKLVHCNLLLRPVALVSASVKQRLHCKPLHCLPSLGAVRPAHRGPDQLADCGH